MDHRSMDAVSPQLKISGQVTNPLALTAQQLEALPEQHQIPCISALLPNRTGAAVTLLGIIELCQPTPEATHLGLHGTLDDFHASIPLSAVRNRGLVVHHVEGAQLETAAGGPFRFFIPDHAACQMDEIDECANVKFLDHIEFTAGKGHDNRPEDDEQHAALHEKPMPDSSS